MSAAVHRGDGRPGLSCPKGRSDLRVSRAAVIGMRVTQPQASASAAAGMQVPNSQGVTVTRTAGLRLQIEED